MMDKIDQFLGQTFAGNTLHAWATALLVIIGAFALARLTHWLLTRVLLQFTARTNTTIDDKLVGSTARPFSYAVMFGCAHAALSLLVLPPLAVKLVGGGLLGALALSAALILMRVVDVLFEEWAQPWALSHDPPINVQVIHIARVSAKIVAGTLVMVAVLQRAGFDVWSVITGLGIGGVAVALAAQQTLGNLFGSLQVMTDQPFKVGDWIRIDQVFGRVQHIGLRSTRIGTTAGQTFVIPNKHIAEATIENLVSPLGQVQTILLPLPYDLPAERLQQACDLALAALAETPGVHPDHLAQVYSFGESAVHVRVIFRVPDLGGFSAVNHALLLNIKRQFDAAGLVFAYPTRTLHVAGAAADIAQTVALPSKR